MDLHSAFRIGRVRGIDIRVHWSWLVIFGLLSWSLAEGLFIGDTFARWSPGERWAAGVATALLFFASVLLHELSHAFVALHYGMPVPSITLFVFGGVSQIGEEMRTAGQEFRVAVAGPLMSGLLAIVFALLWLPLADAGAGVIPAYLAVINALLGAFNLLPGFPLDGGRVFRAFVWARTHDQLRATRIAARLGVAIAYGMIAVGLLNVLAFGLLGGLWYVLIGLFLKSASEGAYGSLLMERALHDVDAAAAMRPPPPPVAAALSLQQLVDERLLRTGERAFLVERGDSVVGLITATDVTRVPREQWATTATAAAMVPVERVITITPTTGVLDALRLMQEHDVNQLPVLEQGRVVGLITRADVMRQIELRALLDARRPAVRRARR